MYNSAKDFLGRGWAFPVEVDVSSGKIKLSEYEDDIKQAIGIILSTKCGERIMCPEFGSLLYLYVFENDTLASRSQIEREAVQALMKWEPRITDIDVSANFSKKGQPGFILNIEYTVRSTNNRFNMVYPFWMTEGEG